MNEQIGLGLTWQDVVHMYECHKLANAGYYLKSRSKDVRLIFCLPKSNKGMKDDYLIALGEWRSLLSNSGRRSKCGTFRISPFGRGFNLLALFLLLGTSFFIFFLVENILLTI